MVIHTEKFQAVSLSIICWPEPTRISRETHAVPRSAISLVVSTAYASQLSMVWMHTVAPKSNRGRCLRLSLECKEPAGTADLVMIHCLLGLS